MLLNTCSNQGQQYSYVVQLMAFASRVTCQPSLPSFILFHIVSTVFTISCLHFVMGLPLFLALPDSIQSVKILFHLSLLILPMWPAYFSILNVLLCSLCLSSWSVFFLYLVFLFNSKYTPFYAPLDYFCLCVYWLLPMLMPHTSTPEKYGTAF